MYWQWARYIETTVIHTSLLPFWLLQNESWFLTWPQNPRDAEILAVTYISVYGGHFENGGTYIFLCKKWTQGHHITLEIKFGWNPTTFKIVRFLPPFWIGHHFENWRPFWIFLKVTCTPSRVIVIKVSHFSPKPL